MKYSFLHLSDLHYRSGWFEEIGAVLHSFKADLSKDRSCEGKNFLIFSGDLVQAGSDSSLYEEFFREHVPFFEGLGYTKDRRIIVPGNHDVDRSAVENSINLLNGIKKNLLTPTQFNDAVRNDYKESIGNKFINYRLFEDDFSNYGCGGLGNDFWGKGHVIDENIGVFCLNTALLSFAGVDQIDDKGHLMIDTRTISNWAQKTSCLFKILVMHHSTEWLHENSRKELEAIVQQHFDLVLYGHDHELKSYKQQFSLGEVVHNKAPALFTRKDEELAYTVIEIDCEKSEIKLKYRSFSKAGNFVPATNLTGTDSGSCVYTVKQSPLYQKVESVGKISNLPEAQYQSVLALLHEEFSKQLNGIEGKPVWVEPTLSTIPEISTDKEQAILQAASSLANDLKDYEIIAYSEFGATTLAKFLISKWWEVSKKLVVYIDAQNQKPDEKALEKYVQEYCARLGLMPKQVSGFCLDNFDADDNKHRRMIKCIKDGYSDTSLIKIKRTIIEAKASQESDTQNFTRLFLWSLDRLQIRSLIKESVKNQNIIDENNAVSSIVATLENLNLPRTPFNCLSLLKIYESKTEASPINRTDLLEKLFSIAYLSAHIPSNFGTLPDQKDALYALGYFCADLFYRSDYTFSKKDFQEILKKYCDEKLMEFDIDVLFWFLTVQKFISLYDGKYYFRFSCWPKFFAAYHMHLDERAFNFFAGDKRYARYPEIAEYYTGLTRQANDFISTVCCDLSELLDKFENTTKIDDNLKVYERLQWQPTPEKIERLESEIRNDASAKSLPEEIKDRIADENYDRSKPHQQVVEQYLDGASLFDTVQVLTAAARILRNSHHASADLKKQLLHQILRGWHRVLQLAVILAPVVVREGSAVFQRVGFVVSKDFLKRPEDEKINIVMSTLPITISRIFSHDLASLKNTPLYSDFLKTSDDDLKKYLVACQIIFNKPQNWRSVMEDYINSLHKNSYFLYAVLLRLRSEYKYGFNSDSKNVELKQLIGHTVARHSTGAEKFKDKFLEEATAAGIKNL